MNVDSGHSYVRKKDTNCDAPLSKMLRNTRSVFEINEHQVERGL